jgi:hypothetical protein
MKPMPALTKVVLSASLVLLSLNTATANTRTLESRFALSADARSEFSLRFPLLSTGHIVIEANWTAAQNRSSALTLVLIRPDGTIAASKSGASALRLELTAGERDLEKLATNNETKWTAKLLNDKDTDRSEVSGTLRIAVPADSRALEDTQFTLLGSGNAQEIPFSVPAPGRLEVEVAWEPDALARTANHVTLVVSLAHPGESRVYARRQGASPIKVQQQVTEQALDLGLRWIVRVENDTQTKVSGTVKITYAPSL